MKRRSHEWDYTALGKRQCRRCGVRQRWGKRPDLRVGFPMRSGACDGRLPPAGKRKR